MEYPDPKEPWECPRCRNVFVGYAALSRLSTPTEHLYVCSDCGVEEAIQQWNGDLWDWRKPKPKVTF